MEAVAALIALAIAAWIAGGLLLRALGWTLAALGLLAALLGAEGALLVALAGGLVWLLGQAHFALRYGEWKSALLGSLRR